METVTPTPRVGPQTTVSTPTPTPTLSQEELSAMAEEVYRTFFDEWVRLERAGGADEPTQILLDNGAGSYLEGVVALLQDQKARGVEIGGPLPRVTVAPTHGDTAQPEAGIILRVCEDNRDGWFEDETGRDSGELVQGTVRVEQIEDRLKVTAARTNEVETCTF